jgi:hypothetical protein
MPMNFQASRQPGFRHGEFSYFRELAGLRFLSPASFQIQLTAALYASFAAFAMSCFRRQLILSPLRYHFRAIEAAFSPPASPPPICFPDAISIAEAFADTRLLKEQADIFRHARLPPPVTPRLPDYWPDAAR